MYNDCGKGGNADGEDHHGANSSPLVRRCARGTDDVAANLSAGVVSVQSGARPGSLPRWCRVSSYIAEQVGLSKRDLIREARMRGIEPDFSEETVQEELS